MAGGGSKSTTPKYLEAIHKEILKGMDCPTGLTPHNRPKPSIYSAIYKAWSMNPYAKAGAYDPAPELERLEASMAEFAVAESGFDAEGQLKASLAEGKRIAAELVSQAEVDDNVKQFSKRQEFSLNAASARIAGVYSGLNAIQASSYVMSLALLEHGNQQEVASFNSQLSLEAYKDKLALIGQYSSELSRLVLQKIELAKTYVNVQLEAGRAEILAKREFIDQDIDLTVKDSLWQLEIFQVGGNILGSINGGFISGPNTPGKTASGLAIGAGALTGAASGAMMGVGVMGIGTLPGALIGGAVGALAASGSPMASQQR